MSTYLDIGTHAADDPTNTLEEELKRRYTLGNGQPTTAPVYDPNAPTQAQEDPGYQDNGKNGTDPFAASGGGVNVVGQWIPKNNPEAITRAWAAQGVQQGPAPTAGPGMPAPTTAGTALAGIAPQPMNAVQADMPMEGDQPGPTTAPATPAPKPRVVTRPDGTVMTINDPTVGYSPDLGGQPVDAYGNPAGQPNPPAADDNSPWLTGNGKVNLPGWDSSRTDSDPKMVFGRFAQWWTQTMGRPWGADAVRYLAAHDPRWELRNGDSNDPLIRVKQSELDKWKPGTSIWQDAVSDSGPGGKNGISFSNAEGNPADGFAPPSNPDAAPGGLPPAGTPPPVTSPIPGTTPSTPAAPAAPGTGGGPKDDPEWQALYAELVKRSQQSLSVDPNDPIIKGQVDSATAIANREALKQQQAAAERGGAYATGATENASRMTGETVQLHAQAMQFELQAREVTARRAEIAQALEQRQGMLTTEQTVRLKELDQQLEREQMQLAAQQAAAQNALASRQLDISGRYTDAQIEQMKWEQAFRDRGFNADLAQTNWQNERSLWY